ncbi:MAG: hypothetical protein N2506_05990 [Dehalococcoidales bacterium]|nr:hypothetical protein [Dehalococcoidales bacterium]
MDLWGQFLSFLRSWFVYPNLTPVLLLASIGLGLVFGAIWLLVYRPPLFRKLWLWALVIFSAFFTLLALTFVQIPLQQYIGILLSRFWDEATLIDWLYLAGIPAILLSGLVQEGAKLVPVVVWQRRCSATEPVDLLAIGALSGAAFGVFEAVWLYGQVLGAGWAFRDIQTYGFVAIAPFWERFFTIGFHSAASAIAAYGLAKGKGWQFYLIASGLHAILNYGVLPYQRQDFGITQVEMYVAGVALAVTLIALWLRAREKRTVPAPSAPAGPAGLDAPEGNAQDL